MGKSSGSDRKPRKPVSKEVEAKSHKDIVREIYENSEVKNEYKFDSVYSSNLKVYGREGEYFVYLGDSKVKISNTQAKVLKGDVSSSDFFALKNIAKETEKAVALNASISFYEHASERDRKERLQIWVPKSMIKDGKIPKWFLDEKLRERGITYNGRFIKPKLD